MGFVLAAAGSAIGLGNIWKFPYIAGQNGGGAFVLIYLLCIAVIGVPVMLCEISIGRNTQLSPVGAIDALKPRHSASAHLLGGLMVVFSVALALFGNWGWSVLLLGLGLVIFHQGWTVVGLMGVVAGFLVLSFYSVVAGWTIGYMGKACLEMLGKTGHFASSAAAEATFVDFIAGPPQGAARGFPVAAFVCHFLFMAMCVGIVIMGVKKGIERWAKILMPLLFFLLIVLILRALSLPDAMKGVQFYLTPDLGKINTNSVLVALGHAFFSLSLGMGVMITYGSYVSREENLFQSVLSVVALDTLVALLAGLAIFPAVFSRGMDPAAGPGLVFQVLPQVFMAIPGGPVWALAFFLFLLVAALTSGISILEVVVAYFIEQMGMSRHAATLLMGTAIFVLGGFCAASVTGWEHLAPLKIQEGLAWAFGVRQPSFFDVLDNVASNWLLPLGGLFISLFVGWIWGTHKAVEEIRHGSKNFADVHLIALLAGLKDDPGHNSPVHVLTLASLWGIFIRFISPTAVLIAFLYTVGWIKLS
jgi:NSS family neurotransmitter:Na+ symporter